MEADLLKALLSSPLFGGGTVAGAIVGILYLLRKGYMTLKADAATTDAMTTSLNSQAQVIAMLRDEVARLSAQVQTMQETVAKQSEERRKLMDQLIRAERELAQCKGDDNVQIQQSL